MRRFASGATGKASPALRQSRTQYPPGVATTFTRLATLGEWSVMAGIDVLTGSCRGPSRGCREHDSWGAMTEEAELAAGVRRGDRRSLARAITLVESQHSDQRELPWRCSTSSIADTGHATRVAISGPPGVGKSTLIESLGMHVVSQGHKVAVLAVDPSSVRTRGSILGDKTRMERLARDPRLHPAVAVVGRARRRRSPHARGDAALRGRRLRRRGRRDGRHRPVGGRGRRDGRHVRPPARAPGGGDELQGIKRGVVELADVVAVTKADGDLLGAAGRAAADYRNALHLMRPRTTRGRRRCCSRPPPTVRASRRSGPQCSSIKRRSRVG